MFAVFRIHAAQPQLAGRILGQGATLPGRDVPRDLQF